MAFVIDCRSTGWQNGYVSACRQVLTHGRLKNSRNGNTTEIRDAIIVLPPESVDLPIGVGRGLNAKLAAAEAIQVCGGISLPDLTEAVAPSVSQYVRDPDGTVHGNYGARIGDQLIDVVDKLRADSRSRQAVIQIWYRDLDGAFVKRTPKDIPCTLSIVIGIYRSALEMSVTMRSNDVWLGLPYDVFQFRQLQRTLARVLEVDVGEYSHHAVSLHAYEKDTVRIHGLHFCDEVYHEGPVGLVTSQPHRLREIAVKILEGSDSTNLSDSHGWYWHNLGEAYRSITEES